MLTIDDLQVHYQTEHGLVEAVKSISLEVKEGEFCTFLGPSGCGKTTTLRCIAGLEEPTRGRILIDNDEVFNSDHHIIIPTHKRNLGMVFQSYAIWPHMSVFENVAFPLHGSKLSKGEVQNKVLHALNMVGLGDFATRSATQLSGGQQQRVALARAIVRNGKVLLLDEPLSNLDAKLRDQMRDELRELQLKLKTTTIFVTHDQDEALAMSDRIIVMKKGSVVEQGTPADLYQKPRKLFTASFIGKAEVLKCEFVEKKGEYCIVKTKMGKVIAKDPHQLQKNAGYVMVRPEAITINSDQSQTSDLTNTLQAKVQKKIFVGEKTEYLFKTPQGHELSAIAPSYISVPTDKEVTLHFHPERCILLEKEQE